MPLCQVAVPPLGTAALSSSSASLKVVSASAIDRAQALLAQRHRATSHSRSLRVVFSSTTSSVPSVKSHSARPRPSSLLVPSSLRRGSSLRTPPSSSPTSGIRSSLPGPRLSTLQSTSPQLPSATSPTLLADYNLHHFGIATEQSSTLTGELSPSSNPSFSSLFCGLLRASNGTSLPSWRHDLPTHASLLRTPFGRPSINHSFTQEASFDTTIFTVLKYGIGFLGLSDFEALCSTSVLLLHLAKSMVSLISVDFRHLRDPDPNWSRCESIPTFKELEFLALLFHYDLHVSAAVRFLGSKYLGGHRNVDQICAQLVPHVDAETISAYRRIMTTGCPNHFNASTTRENAELFRRHGNDSSILRHRQLVTKNMLKEYKHNFAFPLPVWIARYLRHVFYTPQHVHLHPSKPPRQIFNAKKRPTPTAIAVNNMTSTPFGSELDCRYGDVLPRIYKRIWNLRISYPFRDLVLHANDVKSCFRQVKHHPDIVGAFSFAVFHHVWIQIGCTFGSDFSPANWEGVRRTIEQLATSLFDDDTLRTKHRKYLDQLTWDASLDSSKRKNFVPAFSDSQNNGVLDENGNPVRTPHAMFVDDDVYVEVYIRQRVEQAIAASIEAIFITLGYSDLSRLQDPISWDKLFDMVISHFNKALGVDINTRRMDVGPPPEFVARTLDRLKAFHEGRKAFTIQEMSTLVGLLGHIATTSRWLTHLLSHLYTSLSLLRSS